MKPIVFARCEGEETFGIATGSVEGAGGRVSVWEALDGAPRPSLDDVAGVVMFGSSYNVEHAEDQPFIKEARELTREAVDRGVPYLGVCFGAQMLAWSLDRDVVKAPVREVGFEPIRPLPAASLDPLLCRYEDGDRVFQWHMDTFELPDGAEPLITGDRVDNQAFRVGSNAWGIQFHFEIDRDEIELWLDAFSAEADLAISWGKAAADVRAETDRYLQAHQRKGAEVFAAFTRVAAGTDPT